MYNDAKVKYFHNYDQHVDSCTPFADQIELSFDRRFNTFLKKLSDFFMRCVKSSGAKVPTIFFCYAWPEHRTSEDAIYPVHEKWTANFVRSLAEHLGQIGFNILIDVKSSQWDSNPVRFMEYGVDNSQFILLFLSETLKQKAESQIIKHNIKTEIARIKKRINEKQPSGVFQVLLSGSIETSLPDMLKNIDSGVNFERPQHVVYDEMKNEPYSLFLLKLVQGFIERMYGGNTSPIKVDLLDVLQHQLIKSDLSVLRDRALSIMNTYYENSISELSDRFTRSRAILSRPQYFDLLDRAFIRNIHPCIALCGPPGIGKTELSLSYATYLMKSTDRTSIVRFFNADSKSHLEQEISLFCELIGIERSPIISLKDLISELINRLSRWKIHHLLIFENASTWLKEYLPRYVSDKSYVLILSRQNTWPSVIPLEVFSDEEAIRYIGINLPNIGQENTVKLANAMPWYPIFLAQSVAFLQQNSGYDVDQYVIRLQQEPTDEDFAIQDSIGYHYGDCIGIDCFELYRQAVSEVYKISNDAYQLLVAIAYLAADRIPCSIFTKSRIFTQRALDKAIQVLQDYCLVSSRTDLGERCLYIHRVVQACARSQVDLHYDIHLDCIKRILHHFCAVIKKYNSNPSRWRDVDVYLTHMKDLCNHIVRMEGRYVTSEISVLVIDISDFLSKFYFSIYNDYITYSDIVFNTLIFIENKQNSIKCSMLYKIKFLRFNAASKIIHRHYSEAIEIIDEALRLTHDLKNLDKITKKYYLFWVTHYKMIIFLNSGEYTKGEELGRKVEALSQDFLNSIGYDDLETFIREGELYTPSSDNAISITDIKDQLIFFHVTYGDVLSFNGKEELGIERCKKAVYFYEIFNKMGDQSMARYGEIMYLLAAAQFEHDPHSAKRNLSVSRRSLPDIKEIDLAENHFVLSCLEFKDRNYHSAIENAKEAINKFASQGFYKLLSCHMLCVFCYDALGEYGKARDHMEQARNFKDAMYDRYVKPNKLDRIPGRPLFSATHAVDVVDVNYLEYMADTLEEIYGPEMRQQMMGGEGRKRPVLPWYSQSIMFFSAKRESPCHRDYVHLPATNVKQSNLVVGFPFDFDIKSAIILVFFSWIIYHQVGFDSIKAVLPRAMSVYF